MEQCRTQLPVVRVALERLQELEKNLKTANVCFGRETVQHFKQIVEGVSQLEEVRRNVHDVLEVETIKASKLRYKLSQIPNKLNQQIADAVAAVSESKTARLRELQVKIETMTQQIETLEKEHSKLEKENVSLCPTQRKAGAQYDYFVSQLNEVMGKRTSDQITLHETFDNIRDTQRKIVLATRDIADLKEKMNKEHTMFESEKEILTTKFTEMYLRVQNQISVNFEQKSKVDELNVKLKKLNQSLSIQKEINEQLEAQISSLKREEDNLQTIFNEESKSAEDLMARKQSILNELRTLIKNLRRKAEDLQTQILQEEKDRADAEELNQGLSKKSESLHEALMKAKEYELEAKQNIKSLDKRLSSVKEFVANVEEEMSEKRRQIQEFEENIMSVMEKHKDAMDFLTGELEKYNHKLEKENQLRESIRQKREEISKDIMHIKATTEDYLTHLSMHMMVLKKKREKLISEIKRLQNEISIYAEKTVTLKQRLAEAKATTGNTEHNLTTDIEQSKDEIEDMNKTIKALKEELQEKMSNHQTLESLLVEETAVCEKLQNECEEKKKLKSELDNSIAHLKTKTAILLSSKPELKALLSTIRTSLYHQVVNTAEQIKLMEADIYETSRRLERVEIENCKLKLCNFHLVKTVALLNDQEKKQKAAKKQQDAEFQIIYDELLKNWSLDKRIQKEHGECEQSVLNVIDEVMKKINYRKQKSGSIRDQLKEYLSKLQSFVGTTSSIEESRERCKKQIKLLQ